MQVLMVDENERAAANLSYEHDNQVGFGTDTLPQVKGSLYSLDYSAGEGRSSRPVEPGKAKNYING